MIIDDVDIGVLQLSDSFFPTGIFATSNGIEFLARERKIHGMADILEIIRTNIISQIGPSDSVILANTFDGIENFDKIIQIDDIAFSTKLVKEIRDSSVRSGIQMIKCVREFVKNDKMVNQYKKSILENKVHGVFPVAFALCCNALKINKEKCMMMFLYGYTAGIVGASLRLGLIHHFEGQKIIHGIKPVITQTIKEYSKQPLSEMWQFTPQMDIIQMNHEKMDSKMFIT